ncbi:MAG TPA: hypothetical protein VMU75_12935 [Acidimicrobiales bacterium]|nr:hypothetical protein [Acidimicrobiales bacterium]
MHRRLALFANDVTRLGPLIAVVLATLVNAPSLLEAIRGAVTIETALWRFAVAFGLAVVTVRLVGNLLLRYGQQVAEMQHMDDPEEGAVR